MATIQGLELSRRYYAEVVAPWLAREFPGLNHAAALLGYGSELLGFDDEMSRDHDFGARLQLFVSEADFDACASALVGRFAGIAPVSFLGAPTAGSNRHRADAAGDRHGLEVWTPRRAVRHWLAIDADQPLQAVDWLGLAEQRLLAITAGEVFHDDLGVLTKLRGDLAYLPRDVWLYKLACQWRRIAEEQAFVGRAGFVGDDLGSRVIAARLARDLMRLAFLVERRYAPYPKWFGAAFAQLPCAGDISPLLGRALTAPDWQGREEALARAGLTLAKLHLARGLPGDFRAQIGPYFTRPFTVINAEDIAAEIRAAIDDPALRALPLIGSLDQVTDSTAVIEAPGRGRAAMRALLDDVEAGALEEA
ncbi:MAG: DUF4037 domain-containing protein [Caulobacteraceae bacterium]